MIHPKLVFRLESILFTVVGLSYLLFPSWNGQLLFGEKMLRSSEPFISCTMSALGGVCLMLATTFCTAAESANRDMCISVACGHLINSAIKIFSFLSGWSGNVRKGAYMSTLPALTVLGGHTLLAILLWMASAHPAAQKPGIHSKVHTNQLLKEAGMTQQSQYSSGERVPVGAKEVHH